MLGKTNAGGIGGGSAKAALSMTYPEGASCFVSKGSKKITARGNNGRSLFLLPEIGVWDVTTIVDGVPNVKSVEFEDEYLAKSLSYALDIDVFNTMHPMSVNWYNAAHTAEVTVTKVSRGVNYHCINSGNSSDIIISNTAYDVTPYKTLELDLISADSDASIAYGAKVDWGSRLALFSSNTKPSPALVREIRVAEQSSSFPPKNVETFLHVSMDIADLSGEFYPGIKAYCPNDWLFQFTIQKLWFE